MAVFSIDEDRKVIPRWRTFQETIKSGELDSAIPANLQPREAQDTGEYLTSKIADWRRNRTLGHAADLVGAAIVLGRTSEVADAAQFLLHGDVSVSPWVRELSEHVLSSPDGIDGRWEPSIKEVTVPSLRRHIQNFRRLLHAQPGDPITWADLSHTYAILGHERQAERSMNAALQLANNSRFILRSASRFWVHRNDPDRAHDIVAKADRTRYDPWLLAAEIAVGSIKRKTPRYVREARRMLARGQFSANHISELASAVATLDLRSGNVKKSKQFFHQSLEQPTENSLAQAAWASRNHKLHFDMSPPSVPNAFETEFWKNFQDSQWEQTIEQCKLWHFYQPFSRKPVIEGSYVSAIALEDYETSAWFARKGLMANPTDFTLINNLAFALINSGHIEEAKEKLAQAARLPLSDHNRVFLKATSGFLAFRTGDNVKGRELYLAARDQAQNMKDNRVFALASTFYAVEELAKDNAGSHAIRSDALRALRRVPDDPILRLLEMKLNNVGSPSFGQ